MGGAEQQFFKRASTFTILLVHKYIISKKIYVYLYMMCRGDTSNVKPSKRWKITIAHGNTTQL